MSAKCPTRYNSVLFYIILDLTYIQVDRVRLRKFENGELIKLLSQPFPFYNPLSPKDFSIRPYRQISWKRAPLPGLDGFYTSSPTRYDLKYQFLYEWESDIFSFFNFPSQFETHLFKLNVIKRLSMGVITLLQIIFQKKNTMC